MLKICQECHKENKSNYNDLCQRCYNKKWFAKHGSRSCKTCNKKYNGFGINCPSCAKKIRDEKNKGTPCSQCNRSNVLISNKTLCLCTTCYRKKLEKEVEGYKEKRILYNRQSHRKYRGQDPFAPLRRKSAGEGHINKQGYKIITKVGHPNANQAKGAIPEHVFVMSEHLKRPLRNGESVHHKNGIRNDNRIENLELWCKSQPAGQRVEDKIKWARDFLESYGYQYIPGEING